MLSNYTIRSVLKTSKKDKQGLCPVVINLTIDRKVTQFGTSIRITEDAWDFAALQINPRSPDATTLNATLTKSKRAIEKKILNDSNIDLPIIGAAVREELINRSTKDDFFSFIDNLVEYRSTKDADGSITGYKKEIGRIKTFIGKNKLPFNMITTEWIEKYEMHERKRCAQNTLNTTFKWFKRVLKIARKKNLMKEDPFLNFVIPKYIPSKRVFLVNKERELWIKYWKKQPVDDTNSYYITLTYFMIALHTGLRHGDWCKIKESIKEDSIILTPEKTEDTTGKMVVIPIGKSLRYFLDVVKELRDPFSGDKSRDHLKVLAARVGTEKNITTHVGRHSFGVMCAENKIPKSVCAELLGVNSKTVEVYYHLTGETIGEHAAVLRGI